MLAASLGHGKTAVTVPGTVLESHPYKVVGEHGDTPNEHLQAPTYLMVWSQNAGQGELKREVGNGNKRSSSERV